MSKNDSQKSLLCVCVCALLAIGVLVASIGESMYETRKIDSDTEGVCEVTNVTSLCQPLWGHQEVQHARSNRTSGDVALSYEDSCHAPLPVAPQELTIGSQTRCWTRSDADQFRTGSLDENVLAAKALLATGSLLVVAAFILVVCSQTTEYIGDGFNKNIGSLLAIDVGGENDTQRSVVCVCTVTLLASGVVVGSIGESMDENTLAAKVLLAIGSLLVAAAFILLVCSQTTEYIGDGFNKNTCVHADVRLKRKLRFLSRNRSASPPLSQQQQVPGQIASTEDTSTRHAEDPVASATPWIDGTWDVGVVCSVPKDLLEDGEDWNINLMTPEQNELTAGGGTSSSSSQMAPGSQAENMSELS